jgi:CO dehydrogenase maturation factor
MVIAISGKGGTGKTTLAALVVRYLMSQHGVPVLAVDADPNSTLAEKLGVECECTIGDLREEALKSKYDAPAGTPKQQTIEYRVQQSVAEGRGFDLLVMGRGEGPGCYCSVNNMLRTFLHDLSSGYKHVVIDNEAGIEHLSRRTDDKVDVMLVVGDQTPAGLKSAQRIAELVTSLELVRGRTGLVLNRSDGAGDTASEAAAATGLDLLGRVPDDQRIRDFELRGEPLLNLPDDSPAVRAVNQILNGIST